VAENIKITIEAEDRASGVLSQIQSGVKNLNSSVNTLGGTTGTLGKVAKGFDLIEQSVSALASAFLVKETFQYIDSIQTLDNKIRLVTKSSDQFNKTYEDLYDVAQRTRQGIAPTVDLYTKLALSADAVGVAQKDLKTITEAYNKTLVISGASTTGAAAATYQFAQAMQSGKLQGDELRSQLETNPKFMDVLRTTTGLTTAALRELAKDGFLTSALVAQALKDGLGDLDGQMSKMPKTVGQAFTSLSNAFQSTVRDFLETSQAGDILVGILSAIESNIKPLTYAVIALGTAFAIGTVIQAAAFAIRGFGIAAVACTGMVTGLSAALTFLAATPVGRIITGLALAAGAVYSLTDKTEDGTKSQGFFSKAMEWGKEKLADFGIIAGKTQEPVKGLDTATQDLTDAGKKNSVVSAEMTDLMNKMGLSAKGSKTPFDALTASIDQQIKTSALFSDERKRSEEAQKSLDKVIEESRKAGIFYTETEKANMKERLDAKLAERDGVAKATAEMEQRYKGYLDYTKSNQDKSLNDTEQYEKAFAQATQDRIKITQFTEEQYLKYIDSLRSDYTKKYRDLEKQAQDASMTDAQKYQSALTKIEDDYLNNRFQSYDQYTKAKENTDIVHNKKLWDEADKYRIQEGGAQAVYQERLSQLQKDHLAGRFQNEGQYQALVREATDKFNSDVTSKYSNMYSTIEGKLLDMIGVNKSKWPMMKEVISLFGYDSDKILKDLFTKAITYVMGFTNPAGQSITSLGGVFQGIFGSSGSVPSILTGFQGSSTGIMTTAVNGIKGLFSGLGTSISSIFSGLLTSLPNWGSAVGKIFYDTGVYGYNVFRAMGIDVSSIFNSLGSNISGVFSGISSFLKSNVLNVLGDIINGAGSAVSALARVVAGSASSTWSKIVSVGSAIFSFFSDARMKENIQYKQTLPSGINLYDFNYKSQYKLGNETKTGVLAQEVQAQYPNAVNATGSGMMMVDYSKLPIPEGLLKLAKGGVLGGPTLLGGGTALAGEAGPEAVLPLKRNNQGVLGVDANGLGDINVSFTINAVDAKGIDTLLVSKKALITNIVRTAITERGVRI
jgi:tape measure domain-containing protein